MNLKSPWLRWRGVLQCPVLHHLHRKLGDKREYCGKVDWCRGEVTRRYKRGETSPSVTERKESITAGDARVEAEKGHITFYLYFLAGLGKP